MRMLVGAEHSRLIRYGDRSFVLGACGEQKAFTASARIKLEFKTHTLWRLFALMVMHKFSCPEHHQAATPQVPCLTSWISAYQVPVPYLHHKHVDLILRDCRRQRLVSRVLEQPPFTLELVHAAQADGTSRNKP